MPDLTALSEQVEALLAMNRDGACIPKVPNLAVTLLEAQATRIRDLERERDEAFKAGMMRAAEIAEDSAEGFQKAAERSKTTILLMILGSNAETSANIAAAIRAAAIRPEAKGSWG